MAKLILKFEESTLKEVGVGNNPVSVGRSPDNDLHVDNLAVSSHHARIYREGDNLVLEDLNSLNGTFLNNQRVSGKVNLKNGDKVLVGKHTILVEHTGFLDAAPVTSAPKAAAPKLEETVMMDSKRRKELLEAALAAQVAAGGPAAAPKPAGAGAPAAAAAPPRVRVPMLQVLSGSTDQKEYSLSGKLTVIGKSDMATIKIRGFFARLFAPDVAAQINKRDDGYYLGSAGQVPKVNGQPITGPTKLNEGDVIEVGKLKFTIVYRD